jgi:murein tripeptide amidase MpaA
MRYFDDTPQVVEWSSEEIIIPYRSPKDNKLHRYFPDFFVKIKNPDGSINSILIEVKPLKQVKEPTKDPKHPRRYLKEVMTYGINQAKWKAAQEYCDDRRWQFKIMTEKEIGV